MKNDDEHGPTDGNDRIEPRLYPVLAIAAVAVLYIAAIPEIPVASAFGTTGVIGWTATVLGLAAGGAWWISRANDTDSASADTSNDASSEKSDGPTSDSPERRT